MKNSITQCRRSYVCHYTNFASNSNLAICNIFLSPQRTSLSTQVFPRAYKTWAYAPLWGKGLENWLSVVQSWPGAVKEQVKKLVAVFNIRIFFQESFLRRMLHFSMKRVHFQLEGCPMEGEGFCFLGRRIVNKNIWIGDVSSVTAPHSALTR